MVDMYCPGPANMRTPYLDDCASKATVSTADISDEFNEQASSDSESAPEPGLAPLEAAAGSSWSTSLVNSSSSFSKSRLVAVGAERRGDEVAAGLAAAASDGSIL